MINNELDSEKHPLLWVGVDFAGPFYVTFFTCCMTRAVHLELVEDLLANTFKCCLEGSSLDMRPQLIVSDNAKTFQTKA